VIEKVEKGFKWRRGESKDESLGGSPHVPYLTLIGFGRAWRETEEVDSP